MNLTIGIITLNEKNHLNECLKTLFSTDYSIGNIEVLIVDGNSTDGTKEIIESWQKQHSNITYINEPKKGASLARKICIEKAKYDHVAFTDADCEVPKNWPTIMAQGFIKYSNLHPNLVAVGGRNESPNKGGPFLESLSIALNTFAGSLGSTQGMVFNQDIVVKSIPTLNILYDKKKVLDTGNFDESLLSDAEDADMNFRLNLSGYSFIYLKDSCVFHKYRPNAKAWANNMLKYGRGRAKLLKKHGGKMWSPLYMLPLIFLLAFILIIFFPIHPIFFLPLLYFPIIYFYSFYLARKHNNSNYSFFIFQIFIITHFCYAWGMAKELLKGKTI